MRTDENDSSWTSELVHEVEERLERQNGVATYQLKELKDLVGIGRLGHRIRGQMQDALDRADIGYFPDPLPASDAESVRLYSLGSKVARLIMAVVTLDDENDKKLVKFASGNVSADSSIERDAIEKIRRIIDRIR